MVKVNNKKSQSMVVKFIHTADLHLRRDEPFGLDVLSWIVSKAEKLADALIIAGDLFESDVEASFLRSKVRSIFDKSKVPILIVPGNHDYLSYSVQADYGKNVIVLKDSPSFFEFKGLKIVAIPFQPDSDFSQCMKKINLEPQIIITHGTFYDRLFPHIYREVEEEEEIAEYMPIYRWDVEGKTTYLALGHYHSSFTEFNLNETCVVYPGSPVATSKRCIGQRYVAFLSFLSKKKVKVEKIAVDISPYWERCEWMVFPGKEKDVLDRIEKDLQRLASGKVMLDGRVKGSVGISEGEFKENIRKIKESKGDFFKKIEICCEIKNWGELVKRPILSLFIEKLGTKNIDEKIRDRALELTFSALDKLRR